MAYREILFLAVILAALTPISYARVPQKIKGGERTSRDGFPYQVYMENEQLSTVTICGGTIIDTRNILTAAHCLYWNGSLKSLAGWTVTTGSDDSRVSNPENTFGVLSVTPHPNFNKSGIREHDIAIMKLKRQISFDNHQEAAVFSNRNIVPGTNGMFIGWGVPDENDPWLHPYLQKLEAIVISLTACRAWFPQFIIHSYKFCTWSESRGAPCFGDSGSPFIINGQVVGILSQGTCNGDAPAIFTNIYYYRSWIRNNI